MTPHSEHDPKVKPVEGCEECDKEIGRPIPLCYGAGRSSVVVPRKDVKK